MIQNFFSEKHIVSTRDAQQFIQRYSSANDWHNIDFNTGNLGYGWIHYAMIRTLKPKRVLCVGSRSGYIPAICALACKDNRRGIVDFVDAGFDENNPNEPNHWGGAGLWKHIDAKKYFKHFGLSSYINLHVITTQKFGVIKSSWGYIYIDGDHSYKGAKHDYNKFWPRLESDGMMAFHDIYVKRMGTLIFGMYRLWNEIKKTYPHQTIEYPGEFGLGILTKRSTKLHYHIS